MAAAAAQPRMIGERAVFIAKHAANKPCEDVAFAADVPRGEASPGVIAAVLDGHGGASCAQYMAETMPNEFKRKFAPKPVSRLEELRARFFTSSPASASPASPASPGGAEAAAPLTAAGALSATFTGCDDAWLTHRAPKSERDMRAGSCAVACYCEGSRLIVANAGDCRAVLGRHRAGSSQSSQGSSQGSQRSTVSQYTTISITHDHTAQNKSEQEAVRARTSDPLPFRDKTQSTTVRPCAHQRAPRASASSHLLIRSGLLRTAMPLRVAGSLMVTRAMGDGYLKRRKLSSSPFQQYCPYITAQPEMHELELVDDDAFVVLASDGIWDNLENEEVVRIIGRGLVRSCDSGVCSGARSHAGGRAQTQRRTGGAQSDLAQLVIDASLEKICESHQLTRSDSSPALLYSTGTPADTWRFLADRSSIVSSADAGGASFTTT